MKTVFHNGAVKVDPETGEVTLTDGTKDVGDVVVGKSYDALSNVVTNPLVSDGVHSRLRAQVLGSDQHVAKKMGLTCFRMALTADKAREALGGNLPHWWEPSTGKGRISLLEAEDGTPRFITTYPFRRYDMMNVACNFPTRPNRRTAAESWYAEADRGELLELFGDYPEEVVKLLK